MFSVRSEASTDPSSSQQQPHRASGDDLNTGGFFSGMVVARTRRKKAMESTVGSNTPPNESIASLPLAKTMSSNSEAPANAPVGATTEGKDFYMRIELPIGELRDEEEDPRQAEMRDRLVRFYEEYNPSKISQVEHTLHLFLGREEELFAELVKKYGPEPRVLQASVLPQFGDSKARERRSDVESAFGFITSGQTKNETHAVHTNDNVENDNNNNNNSAAVAANGGFSFIECVPPVTGVRGTSANISPHSEEPLSVPNTAAGVAEEARPTPISDAPVADAELHSDGHDGEPAVDPGDEPDGDLAFIPDGDERETVWDRHRRELRDAHSAVLCARASLTDGVESLCAAVADRRASAAALRALSADLDRAVAREAFSEADALSAAHARAVSSLSALDAAPLRHSAALCAAAGAAEAALRSLAALLSRQARELGESRDEEAARLQRAMAAAAFRLETRAEAAAAAESRAQREEAHARAEVERLRRRQSAMAARVEKESSALREARERADGEIAALEEERAALVARLGEVQAALEERNAARRDAEAQLQSVVNEGAALESQVEEEIEREEQRLHTAAREADELRRKRSDMVQEEEAFEQRRDTLLAELRDSGEKSSENEKQAEKIRTETTAELRAFIDSSVLAVIKQRATGAGVLFEPIDLPKEDEESEEEEEEEEEEEQKEEEMEEDSGDAANPLAAVRRLEESLCALDARHTRRAAAVSAMSAESSEIRARLSHLDAAKRAAAAGRRFREAQRSADELRVAHERLEEINAAQERAAVAEEKYSLRRAALRQRIAVARSASTARVEAFLAAYRSALDAAARAEPPNLLQPPAEDADALRDAGRRLFAALREELDAACAQTQAETNTQEEEHSE